MVLVARLAQQQSVKSRRSSECAETRPRLDVSIPVPPPLSEVQVPGLRDIFSWLTGSRGLGQIEAEEQDVGHTDKHKSAADQTHASGDAAVRFLGFIAATSEVLSDIMPPSAINACYAMAIAKIVNGCHEVAEATHACHHRYKVWNGTSVDEEEETVQLPGGGLGRRPISARKALLRDSIKLFMTVAMPTLMLHAVEKTGWDMLTQMPAVMDALQSAAEHLAQGLHLPNADIAKLLAQAAPSIAGSFLVPMLTKPVEHIVEAQMERKFRPALHEFLSTYSLSCSQSFIKAVSQAMSSLVSPGAAAKGASLPLISPSSGVSFLSHTLSLATPRSAGSTLDYSTPSPALWQSYTTLGILYQSIAPFAVGQGKNAQPQHSSQANAMFIDGLEGGRACHRHTHSL